MLVKQFDPPLVPSEEATNEELAIALHQGEIFGDALEHMLTEVADFGEEIHAGPYLLSYAIEDAEGMYTPGDDGELVWQETNGENLHLEVSVRDAADGRFIPELIIYARLIDSDGNEVGKHRLPFIWHPWLYYYGRNWHVKVGGIYSLEVEVKAPTFARHDIRNGNRYDKDVKVVFSNVEFIKKIV